MTTYEAPELLAVGSISGVVRGEKDFSAPDNSADPDTAHIPTESILDVD